MRPKAALFAFQKRFSMNNFAFKKPYHYLKNAMRPISRTVIWTNPTKLKNALWLIEALIACFQLITLHLKSLWIRFVFCKVVGDVEISIRKQVVLVLHIVFTLQKNGASALHTIIRTEIKYKSAATTYDSVCCVNISSLNNYMNFEQCI